MGSPNEIEPFNKEEATKFGAEILKYIDDKIIELKTKYEALERENQIVSDQIKALKDIFGDQEEIPRVYLNKLNQIWSDTLLVLNELDRLENLRLQTLHELSGAVRSHSISSEIAYMGKKITQKIWRILEMFGLGL